MSARKLHNSDSQALPGSRIYHYRGRVISKRVPDFYLRKGDAYWRSSKRGPDLPNCLPELPDAGAGRQAGQFDKQEADLYNPPS